MDKKLKNAAIAATPDSRCRSRGSLVGGGHLIQGNVLQGGNGLIVYSRGNRIVGNVFSNGGGFGLWLTTSSSGNHYQGNSAFGNGGGTCGGPGTSADFCDEGTGNVSGGGNYLPSPK